MLVVSAMTGYVVGELVARARRGTRGVGSLARDVERFGEEQAALRRVATLIARAAAPEEVFAAVSAEVGRVLHADFTTTVRCDPDGGATVLGAFSSAAASPITVGTRVLLGGQNVTTLVFATGRPARIDNYTITSRPDWPAPGANRSCIFPAAGPGHRDGCDCGTT